MGATPPRARIRSVLGLETEYAIAPVGDRREGGDDPGSLAGELARVVRRRNVHLGAIGSNSLFLANGSRFYIDAGGHPELAASEANDPDAAVTWTLAGDRILQDAIASSPLAGRARLYRSSLCYATGHQWGSHENFLYRVPQQVLAPQLIPHLVSRIVLTGAGGFDPAAIGVAFRLSPRVAVIGVDVGGDTMHARSIFDTRDESLTAGPYRRAHLVCGESNRSHTSLWLRLATTALVVAMIDAGLAPGEGLALKRPVEAMKRFSGDPSLGVEAETTSGERLTALQIQHRYLERAEAALGSALLPEWAEVACRRWREALARLSEGPEASANRLDWAIKLALFRGHAARRGFSWEEVVELSAGLEQLGDRWRAAGADARTMGLLRRRLQGRTGLRRLEYRFGSLPSVLRDTARSEERIRELLRLRHELLELDWRYAELGPDGLFERLDDGGALAHRVVDEAAIRDATTRPPATGRARLRGRWIGRLAGTAGAVCDWSRVVRVVEGTNRREQLDLSDPFADTEQWKMVAAPSPERFVSRRARRLPRERLDGLRRSAALRGHEAPVSFIRFSPDGRHLVTSSVDRTVRLWEPARQNSPVATLQGHTRPVRLAIFSPDGRTIASAADDGSIHLWNPATLEYRVLARDERSSVRTLAFSPDGTQLASGWRDGSLRIFSLRGTDDEAADRGDPNPVVLCGHDETIYGMDWSSTGALATAAPDGRVLLWDLEEGRPRETLLDDENAAARDLSWSPDGEVLAAACADGRIRLLRRGRARVNVLRGHRDYPYQVRYSPDQRLVASKSADGTLRLWHAHERRCLAVMRQQSTDVWPRGLDFHPTRPLLAVRGVDTNELRLWRMDLGVLFATSETGDGSGNEPGDELWGCPAAR